MTDSDGREPQQGSAGGPPSARRFGTDAPAWPSLRPTPETAPATSPTAGPVSSPTAGPVTGPTGSPARAGVPAPGTGPLTPVRPSAELPAPTGSWPVVAPAAGAGEQPSPRGGHAAEPAPEPGPTRRSARRTSEPRAVTGAHAAVPPAVAGTAASAPWGASGAVGAAGADVPTASVPLATRLPVLPADQGPVVGYTPAPAAVPEVAADPVPEPSDPAVGRAAGASVPPGLLPAAGAVTDGVPAAEDDAEPPRRSRRTRYLVLAGIVVLVAAGLTAFLLSRDDSTVASPADVVLPSPTSTVQPVTRTATTPFATALPSTVLQYALAGSDSDATWLARNAIEAYSETYTDGGSGTVTVQAGQWATADTATTAFTALSAELPTVAATTGTAAATDAATGSDAVDAASTATVLESGDVLVDGVATGTYTVVDAGDGTGVALWRNGTTVFRVVGPVDDIANLYAAYPL